ncbi:MAG TPA: 2-oxoglutarate dehydrogenase, E2 component, dihydrolipoamide succinyltransferase [Gemmatimonadaceae bacterium]|nr:2-oxoglutarate dehydrogenase, E2 component, dihydrolipoamide succinyltransferase [Gemmatimonadaceae bacterium]
MARVDVVMPQMGESIAEGTLSKWLKKVGDQVKRDEPIFEISTDKVDAEIPAPSTGVLAEILVTEGQTVPVSTVVARLETDVAAGVSAAAAAPTPAPAAAVASSPAAPTAPSPAAPAAPPPAAPAAPHPAAPAAPHPAASAATNGNSLEDRLRTKSSPLVRRIAAEHGIEINGMQGSGIAGRVTKKDILQFIESGAKAPPAQRPAPGAQPVHAGPLPEPWPGDDVQPMSKMRAIIAEHMVVSKHTSAHVNSFFEVDFTRIARIRAKHRAEFEKQTGEKLTYLPFIIKAVTDGLRAFPVLNAAVRGNEVIYRKQINVGIAVALDWGLIVPVIKGADNLSLTGLTRSLNDLANRARSKRLDPREVQDGTFTITNPGVFGSLMGTPIINQPQVAILCLGTIEKRPKVITGADGEDTIAIRTCAYLSLSFDHRIVDGADADKFMSFVKKGLETFPENVL